MRPSLNTNANTNCWALPGAVREYGDGGAAIICGSCKQCATLVFPKPSICPTCLSTDVGDHDLVDGGILYSYTIVHAARAGWPSPYAIGYVDFPGNVRVCGPLDLPASGVALDIPVKIRVGLLRTDADGTRWLSHRFEPVTQETVKEGRAP
jgi:uncharacterized OB-fold protein